jgi:hypothetical protein
MKTITLAHIRIDGGTQVRRSIDQEMVRVYCEAMEGGAKFPAIIVFHDGTDYWCADGFHRIMAANRCGFTSFECDVQKGTADDAAWFALGANKAHGKRLNRSDVRNAIAMALRKFGGKSNRQIAEQIGCSHVTVEVERKDLESIGQIDQCSERTTKDGRQYPATREAAELSESHETTDTEQKDESSPNIGAAEARKNSTAMQHVSDAIAAMRKIKSNDPARAHAFAHLRKWMKDNE